MARASSRRVVVTGLGAVSAWGWGIEPLWDGLCSDRTAVGSFDRFPNEGYFARLAAQVPEPPPEIAARLVPWKRSTLAERFALAAAFEATAHAGLGSGSVLTDAGVFFGGSTGGMFECEEYYRGLGTPPARERSLARLATQPVSSSAETVACALRASGPVETYSAACVSSTLAVAAAFEAVRHGEITLAVAGGSDSLCRVTFGGFNALRAVDQRPCSPFRVDRAGMSLGEGAAVLILEEANAAAARGVVPLVEIVGAGASADAHHMTAPDPTGEGASLAVLAALEEAGLDPANVDTINAHGTGTLLNDAAEFRALERAFGPRLRSVPLTSIKGSVGHLLGSAGAIEAVATVLSLHRGSVPPTAGSGAIDEDTPVCLVREAPPGEHRLEVAVSLNLGFGGGNGALVMRRWTAA